MQTILERAVSAASFPKMKSTARYIGAMSDNGQITAENVLLDNVDLDTGRGVDEFRMQLASPTFLGFRQLPIPRWRASPLYFVGFARPDTLGKVALPLTVTSFGPVTL